MSWPAVILVVSGALIGFGAANLWHWYRRRAWWRGMAERDAKYTAAKKIMEFLIVAIPAIAPIICMGLLISGCRHSKVTKTSDLAPLEKVAETSNMSIYRLRLGAFDYIVIERNGGGTAIIPESTEPKSSLLEAPLKEGSR